MHMVMSIVREPEQLEAPASSYLSNTLTVSLPFYYMEPYTYLPTYLPTSIYSANTRFGFKMMYMQIRDTMNVHRLMNR